MASTALCGQRFWRTNSSLLLPVWSLAPLSNIWSWFVAALSDWNCIGSMFPTELCSSLASWCSTVCVVKRLNTCLSTACQSHTLHHNGTRDLPVVNFSSDLGTGWVCLVDGRSLWLIHWSGTRCLTYCLIMILSEKALNLSRLQVLPFTYLLYLQSATVTPTKHDLVSTEVITCT